MHSYLAQHSVVRSAATIFTNTFTLIFFYSSSAESCFIRPCITMHVFAVSARKFVCRRGHLILKRGAAARPDLRCLCTVSHGGDCGNSEGKVDQMTQTLNAIHKTSIMSHLDYSAWIYRRTETRLQGLERTNTRKKKLAIWSMLFVLVDVS